MKKVAVERIKQANHALDAEKADTGRKIALNRAQIGLVSRLVGVKVRDPSQSKIEQHRKIGNTTVLIIRICRGRVALRGLVPL